MRAAVGMSLSQILVTYRQADNCIPLTAFYRLLIDGGVRLSEMVLRLPMLASGIVLLAVLPLLLARRVEQRTAIARAMALDPEILFFDEPSAGLDPISSRMLDDLILELRESLGTTIVVVTHELASIFAIGNNSVFLDPDTKTMTAQGDPKALRDECPDPKVRNFLLRGELAAEAKEHAEPAPADAR